MDQASAVSAPAPADSETIELSVVIPCLNEAETLGRCVEKARLGLERLRLTGEIVVADNGSTDGSVDVALRSGARVVRVKDKGYGSALRGGIEAARGEWIIMGDADDSYDFSRIEGLVGKLREGYDLVMGCRLPSGGGTIEPAAMPWKNRWIGNPILSRIGRLFFACPARDFHCGLRGFTKAGYERMGLKTSGMEFASEMVIKATFTSLRIAEVPITLHRDGRSRSPHLRPWRDGWRHLRFMLIYSPRWLFMVPGLLLVAAGLVPATVLALTPVHIGRVAFDTGTLAVSSMSTLIGMQLAAFALFTKVFAVGEGLLPQDPQFARLFRFFNLERGIGVGLAMLCLGLAWLLHAVWIWKQANFGDLSYGDNMRRLIPAVALILGGVQVVFSSFFMSVLGLKTGSRRPPA
jgi:hypothetical protein